MPPIDSVAIDDQATPASVWTCKSDQLMPEMDSVAIDDQAIPASV